MAINYLYIYYGYVMYFTRSLIVLVIILVACFPLLGGDPLKLVVLLLELVVRTGMDRPVL